MNEERAARGEHPLAQLPPAEEERIWRQVDQGGGSGAGANGYGQQTKEQPIRSWHDLGTAVSNDLSDLVGSSFGLDIAELTRADAAASSAAASGAAASPAAGSAASGAAASTDGHHDQHKKIEPDDIDLDELGHRLYDRIRSRLRLELLLDRERAGLLSDFR
jgi:ribosomal protein L12E/L44/L45/RPP1/RPP2